MIQNFIFLKIIFFLLFYEIIIINLNFLLLIILFHFKVIRFINLNFHFISENELLKVLINYLFFLIILFILINYSLIY